MFELKNGEINEIKIDPRKIGVKFNNPNSLKGQDADYNASKIIDIFKGEDNDFSKAVCLNAAAGLIVSEKHTVFTEAYQDSRKHILSGKAFIHLENIKNG